MKLLVTGGAGFIGSNFLYYHAEKYPSDELVCVDALTYAGNLYTIEPLIKQKKVVFYKADVTNREEIERIFREEKPDIVVHFAAESHVDRAITDPGTFVKTNVVGTQVMLDVCRCCGVKRFHQASTDEVYGELPLVGGERFTERSPLRPSGPYSASKAAADLLVLAYCKTYGLPVTISRCSNNYGPYQFPEKLIPLAITNALNGKKIPIYGDGKNVRDWVYVTDHCEGIERILRDGKEGKIYNIGGYFERDNLSVVHAIISLVGRGETEFVPDRLGHDRRYSISSNRTSKELGWEPKTNFEEGLQKTVQWYKNNASWTEKIFDGSYRNAYSELFF